MRAQLEEHQRRLLVLSEYLEQAPVDNGRIDAGAHARQRRFAAQVEDAVRQQREQLLQVERDCDDAHDTWARLRADRRALERLREQRRSEALRRQHRVEQQQLDEAAGNRWLFDRGDKRA